MDPKEIERVMARCTRFLAGHALQTPRQILQDLAEAEDAEAVADHYGKGDLISGFEAEIAGLLGKEAAVFMPSGTMAQQIVLRLWAERRKSPHVAFHPLCHLEIHEEKGYQLLHGLHAVLVGLPNRLLTLEDLRAVGDPLAALLIELPQREIGGQLPAWEELQAQAAWARERGIPLHMDGARLWECKPFYGREYVEIAALFDSVYVSFYKGLGGVAGAALAGPADLIADARVWQRRHGGNLIRLFPYVLSARQGLASRLPRMQAYHDKAVEIAECIRSFPEIEILPHPPHTNMMHIYIQGERDRLEKAALEVAEETGVWLFGALAGTTLPTLQRFELSAGDATLGLSGDEIQGLFQALLEKARP